MAALDNSVCDLARAHGSGSRPETSAAAHRVLSLARMVGAASLAGTAADLQEFASVYTEAELAEEIGKLSKQASELKAALAERAKAAHLTPAWVS